MVAVGVPPVGSWFESPVAVVVVVGLSSLPEEGEEVVVVEHPWPEELLEPLPRLPPAGMSRCQSLTPVLPTVGVVR